MRVVQYLKDNGIQALVDNYAVRIKDYPRENLIVLNYCQIDSPKNDPITNECRGLILTRDYFRVVSRSFDRFFNYGECNTDTRVDFSKCRTMEKVDGSLIKIYFYQGYWYASTRGTAFAETEVNGWGLTFDELVHRAVGVRVGDFYAFQRWCDSTGLCPDYTYICELTAMENRVVTRYVGTNLYLLAVRNNETGEFVTPSTHTKLYFEQPKYYSFDSIEHCLEVVKGLPDLQEGYVLYCEEAGQPLCKIKSPIYVAVHRIKGEGLTPKRIAQLVLMNEQDEYLTYFPEDAKHFTNCLWRYEQIKASMQLRWDFAKNATTQKEFALLVKDHSCSAVLFKARNSGQENPNLVDLFHSQTEAYQLRALGVS